MKLSEKGYAKVFEKCTYKDPDDVKDNCILIEKGMNPFENESTLDELEFEPNDFTDCVVLTVEEAKEILKDYTDTVCIVAKQCGYHEVRIAHPDSIKLLLMRIEQAKVENGV